MGCRALENGRKLFRATIAHRFKIRAARRGLASGSLITSAVLANRVGRSGLLRRGGTVRRSGSISMRRRLRRRRSATRRPRAPRRHSAPTAVSERLARLCTVLRRKLALTGGAPTAFNGAPVFARTSVRCAIVHPAGTRLPIRRALTATGRDARTAKRHHHPTDQKANSDRTTDLNLHVAIALYRRANAPSSGHRCATYVGAWSANMAQDC